MRISRSALFLVALTATTPALAQSTTHDHGSAAAPSAAAKQAFDKLKTLAGSWAGRITTTPDVPSMNGQVAEFSLAVTSRGNALLHELTVSGLPDHPVTLFYLDGGLTLTHYCDAGNRPRMVGTLSPDGKTLRFEFADLSGDGAGGYMYGAEFTFIDENHHTEEWIFKLPGDRQMRARFDLRRTSVQTPTAAR